jgi:glycosyltransferase involved in cell wall biosynthesis
MTEYPRVGRFESASVIIPVINETTSLRQTVDVILRDVKRELVKELLIVVCPRTTPESMATIAQLQNELGGLVVVHQQQLPFLGGALREGFQRARGSHVIMMSSDLETDPNVVRVLIAEAEKNPSGIVTTSRWISGGSFHGYSKIKLVCNWVFQRFFSLLYQTHLTDMTFGFRIMPVKLAQAIQWEELRHPFNLESIVKPLRLGVPVAEIHTTWHARVEGESQNPFLRNFEYFRIGLKVRFARKETLLRSSLKQPR